MKKFWKKKNGSTGGSISSSAIEQPEVVNSVDGVETSIKDDEKISSPLVLKPKTSMKTAKSADDNVAEANEEATVASNSDGSSANQPNTGANEPVKESLYGTEPRRIQKDEESITTKAKKAYSCFSGSVYTVAATMDSMLTTCSNTCCAQVEDESQFNSEYMSTMNESTAV